MNDLASNISRFCILFFCAMVFLTRARNVKDQRAAVLGMRYQTMFRVAAIVTGSVGLLCLCLAGVEYFR